MEPTRCQALCWTGLSRLSWAGEVITKLEEQPNPRFPEGTVRSVLSRALMGRVSPSLSQITPLGRLGDSKVSLNQTHKCLKKEEVAAVEWTE